MRNRAFVVVGATGDGAENPSNPQVVLNGSIPLLVSGRRYYSFCPAVVNPPWRAVIISCDGGLVSYEEAEYVAMVIFCNTPLCFEEGGNKMCLEDRRAIKADRLDGVVLEQQDFAWLVDVVDLEVEISLELGLIPTAEA